MNAPRQYHVEAVVLGNVLVGEKDKIVTLFSREQGKLRVVARGAVRPGSSLGPCAEPLTHARFFVVRRRSIDLMTQAVPLTSFPSLKSDLLRMSCGLYMAELVDSSTEEGVPHGTLYDLMVVLLQRLDAAGHSDALLRYFELRWLNEIGFRPALQRCVDCGQKLEPVDNALSARLGGVVCPDCAMRVPDARPLSLDALKVLRFWLAEELETGGRVKLDESLAAELDAHLYRLILAVLQRDIKSRAWLSRLKEEGPLTRGADASTIASRLESQ